MGDYREPQSALKFLKRWELTGGTRLRGTTWNSTAQHQPCGRLTVCVDIRVDGA